MKPSGGGSYLGMVAATGIVSAIVGGAWLGARGDLEAVRWMHSAPYASAARPSAGAAWYRGRARGPAGRLTPSGSRSAAHWWRVTERTGKTTRTVCLGDARSDVDLIADGARVPIAFLAAARGVSLVADSQTWDWNDRVVVDFGSWGEGTDSSVPRAVARCAGERRRYLERFLPHDAPVEVLGCVRAGRLESCGAVLHGVVTVTSARAHVLRRAAEARFILRVAGVALFWVISVMGIVLLTIRARVYKSVSRPAGTV